MPYFQLVLSWMITHRRSFSPFFEKETNTFVLLFDYLHINPFLKRMYSATERIFLGANSFLYSIPLFRRRQNLAPPTIPDSVSICLNICLRDITKFIIQLEDEMPEWNYLLKTTVYPIIVGLCAQWNSFVSAPPQTCPCCCHKVTFLLVLELIYDCLSL